MSRAREEELGHGDDSFLDIVANLVGVMIILIVVMGVRSQAAAKQTIESGIAEKIEAKMDAPKAKMQNLKQDLSKQADQLTSYALEVNARRQERDALLNQVNAIQMAIEEELSKQSESERESLETQQEISKLERELADLLQQQGDSTNPKPETIVLQHLPTPMAKTVFNKEVHLMLRQGKVTVIPWDRLVDSLKKQVELSVRRNSRKEVIDEQLGPIAGFMMEYRLVAKRGMVTNGTTTGMGQMVALDRFELEPTSEAMAESVEDTLSDSGRLKLELAGRNPKETVTTVWVYPDSFAEFRVLKESLFSMGFMTAARPLPNGVRIGAAPSGSHSSAQ